MVMNRNRIIFISLLIGFCAIVGMGIGYVTGCWDEGVIFPGVSVDCVQLGGLSITQAALLLEDVQPSLLPIQLIGPGGLSWELTPEQLGFVVDVDAMTAYAYGIGRRGSLKDQVSQRIKAGHEGISIPWILKVQGERFGTLVQELAGRLYIPPQDASFHVNPDGSITIIPSVRGRALDADRATLLIKNAVLGSAQNTVTLPIVSLEPRLTTEEAENCQINALLASYTTHYNTKDVDRSHNVALAACSLDGAILHRKETFSFNSRIGSRVSARGYRNAPVIVDGEMKPDIGGGVCQVSSTLYAAVVLAGLSIVERFPHSIPVTYMPLGQDATVVDNVTDLKFQNDLDHCVLIKAKAEEGTLTIDIYGQRPGFIHELFTQFEHELAPSTVYVSKAELSPGQQVIEKPGARGFVVSVWKIQRDERGLEHTRTFVNRTIYQARPRIIQVPEAE